MPTRAKLPSGLDPAHIPRHIAVIMDGNGRWARERGLPRIQGHEAGAEAVRACVEGCGELRVPFLTLYAFSAENWKRPPEETSALMRLMQRFLDEKRDDLVRNNVRLEAIGRLDELPGVCRRALRETIEATRGNDGLTLVFALSYGGRDEIIDAVRGVVDAVVEGRLDRDRIGPELFSQHLYTRHYPDPDLLIRTSGELRVSNFLLWQIAYTEIWVTDKYWPDFRKEDLFDAVREFGRRHRRYGAL